MSYVDGIVCAVPTANRQVYLEHAKEAAALFRKHGALSVVECWGDDVPEGKVNSFHTAVLREPEETVVFSWITWPSKAVRDTGMAAFMADPAMKEMGDMPFDGRRMIFGGFETVLEA